MIALEILGGYLLGAFLNCAYWTYRRAGKTSSSTLRGPYTLSFAQCVWGGEGPWCLVWMFWPVTLLLWLPMHLLVNLLHRVHARALRPPKIKLPKLVSTKCPDCQQRSLSPAPRKGVFR